MPGARGPWCVKHLTRGDLGLQPPRASGAPPRGRSRRISGTRRSIALLAPLPSAPSFRSVEKRAARRRHARIRIARPRADRCAAFRGAVARGELLTFRRLTLCLALLIALIALRDATAHDVGRRRRARIRLAAAGAHIHAALGAALCGTLFLALGPVVVGSAALNVRGRRAGRAGVRKAGAGAQIRAALGRTLIGRRLLALGAVVVREAALHVALVFAVVGHLGFHHVLALVVAHLDQLAARVDPEGLRVPTRRPAEASHPRAGRAGGETPDPHTRDADPVRRAGLQVAPANTERSPVPLGVDRRHGHALGVRVDPGRVQRLLDRSGARSSRHERDYREGETPRKYQLAHLHLLSSSDESDWYAGAATVHPG